MRQVLLQSATASLIHILLLESVRIFLQSVKILLKFSAGIAKRDDYYNVRQNSTEVIRKYNSPLNSRKHKNTSQ